MTRSRAPVRERLSIALGISAAIVVTEVFGGIVSHSLALLADAGHTLTDLGALLLSYIAVKVSERSTSPRHTFGLHRAEILAAFINAQVLLLASGWILYESYRRIMVPGDVAALPMLLFGVFALAANGISLRFLHPHRAENLNLKAAYLEVAADTLASAAVIVGAATIARTGAKWIDPALSAAIALFILPRTVTLLRQSAHILLEGAPSEIDQADLLGLLGRLPGVMSVHDLHLWTMTSGVHYASLHVAILPDADPSEVLTHVQDSLRREKHIEHATVQIEVCDPADCDPALLH